MSEWRKISAQDQDKWLDEAAAAQLLLEAQSRAPSVALHPDGPKLLNVRRGHRALYAEHWLIMGIWLATVMIALWRFMF